MNNGEKVPEVEPLWTVLDVARFLRRSERWVRGHQDELGAIRNFGGVRFDPAAVRALARPAPPARVLDFPTKAR